ncbi:MAG: PhoH family protein [Sphingomonadaceae bacterium]
MTTLDALYARLESGRTVEPGDIDAALRMGRAAAARDQLELFEGGRVEIRTRKKTVEPRTAAQKAYAHALFTNELVFGIGPAGTGKTYLAVAQAVALLLAERLVALDLPARAEAVLTEALAARPVKSVAYAPGRVAFIDAMGELAAVSGAPRRRRGDGAAREGPRPRLCFREVKA